MKLKVKFIDILSGHALIAIINQDDAAKMDIHPLDRIKIKKGKKIETVVVDISAGKLMPRGKIGIIDKVKESLNLKNGEDVEIILARKPLSLDFIKRKLDGSKLTKNEIDQIVWDIVHNKLSEIEMTYFVAACYANKMDDEETVWLTKAMAGEGDTLKLKEKIVMDKHCVGGVAGNRTTMVVVPIVAAAGLKIPKTSSRSITSPAGTGDTMEVLANVCVPLDKMKKIVERVGGCVIWGGSLNLAPADDKIIKVERPLAIDAKSQLLASVMAKKLSVSATNILVDIPAGKGSKIENLKKATNLKKAFENISKKLGVKVRVLITCGSEPIGNGIGPALEARDVLWVLKNDPRSPMDLKRKSLMMAGLMLEMGKKAKRNTGLKIATNILESGTAYRKMIELINAQGKNVTDPDQIKIGPYSYQYKSPKTGKITAISNNEVSKVARIAGAPFDKGSGIYLRHHIGDRVLKGDILFDLYAHNPTKMDFAKQVMKESKIFEIK